jgi:hypothetical protein
MMMFLCLEDQQKNPAAERVTEEEQTVCHIINSVLFAVGPAEHFGSQRRKRTVTTIIDTGSQWPYILQKTVL